MFDLLRCPSNPESYVLLQKHLAPLPSPLPTTIKSNLLLVAPLHLNTMSAAHCDQPTIVPQLFTALVP